MSKSLHCNDLMPGCDYVARGATEQEVLTHAAAHAREKHNLKEISSELLQKVRAAIRDEKVESA